MFCEEFIKKISLYIDGYLSEAEREEIEAHMEKCDYCKKIYEDILTIKILAPSLEYRYNSNTLRRRQKRKKILKFASLFMLLLLIFSLVFNEIHRVKKIEVVRKERKKEVVLKRKVRPFPVKIYYTDMSYEVSYEQTVP